MKQIITFIKAERGSITADWITLAGGAVILTLVLTSSIQQDLTSKITKVNQAFTVTFNID
ncbi:MAG: hypothetical protein ACU0B7_08800 [Paracoccaceae bacterium]|uniref:hypothetical protein n=1 Tax=Seohaeicola saemankumensis TaxID=481181 RepID=UPI001E4F5955|nr:hypothetical protein [Seohaeicola saemankumensis]MCD1625071.1 hypothetical protein [Seohaeicola saemankumensis]